MFFVDLIWPVGFMIGLIIHKQSPILPVIWGISMVSPMIYRKRKEFQPSPHWGFVALPNYGIEAIKVGDKFRFNQQELRSN